MPDITITLTQAQIARLDEAWAEAGVPLRDSVLKALAKVTKDQIRKVRSSAAAEVYVTDSEAADAAEEAEFGAW